MYYQNFKELSAAFQQKVKDFVVVGYYNMPDYAGMVKYVGISYHTEKNQYDLNLEWMSLGLDFYGDTLQESCTYRFDDLKKLTDYMAEKHFIQITDIPIKYKSVLGEHPNPLTHEKEKPLFEKDWQRFQKDFKDGLFLDRSLLLIHSSLNRSDG